MKDLTTPVSMAPHPGDNVHTDTAGMLAEDRYTFASAVAGCPVHRPQREQLDVQRAEYDAAIDRLDRRLLRQLDLRFSRATRAVNA